MEALSWADQLPSLSLGGVVGGGNGRVWCSVMEAESLPQLSALINARE